MFGGGGGLNPRKMQQMMKQMGIELEEVDATSVIIRTEDGEELVFDQPDVTRMDARGQQTYQIVGDPTVQSAADTDDSDADAEIPEADIEIVAQRTGASEAEARKALEESEGDLAAAVSRLE